MNTTREELEEALSFLPPYKAGSTWMGIPIEDFPKETLVRIMEWQNDKIKRLSGLGLAFRE